MSGLQNKKREYFTAIETYVPLLAENTVRHNFICAFPISWLYIYMFSLMISDIWLNTLLLGKALMDMKPLLCVGSLHRIFEQM